jgi:calcineurin-like phosphoesterase family protein
MGLFFTADTHFGHKNIIKLCGRPFENAQEMDERLIETWNGAVGRDDIIYHLGDFAWRIGKRKMTVILTRLNGRKFLCRGTHDGRILKLASYFEDIQNSFLIGVNGSQLIFMSHRLQKTWPGSDRGSWHLFGHSHGSRNAYAEQNGKLLDVGVDSHNFRPWSLKEITQIMAKRPPNPNGPK